MFLHALFHGGEQIDCGDEIDDQAITGNLSKLVLARQRLHVVVQNSQHQKSSTEVNTYVQQSGRDFIQRRSRATHLPDDLFGAGQEAV